MILTQKPIEEIVVDSDFQAQSFNVDSSELGIMFSTISEGLYSNPVGSVIREIVSNAIDATVEAGKLEPVIVALSSENGIPYFSVQDFGVGLSPDRIENVYKKLFKSTKRNTNTQIGAYGLGRFSVFSYTDTYQLISVYEGVKTTYQLYLNNSIPDMIELQSEPTTESNGTTVKLAVKSKDLLKFTKQITETLLYFKNIYVINDFSSFDNENFKVYEEEDFIYNPSCKDNEVHISYGGVYYPINYNTLDIKSIPGSFAIKFDNGELDTTRSREDIRYTEKSIAAINSKLEKLQDWLTSKNKAVLWDYTEINDESISKLENHKVLLDFGGIDYDFKKLFDRFYLQQDYTIILPYYRKIIKSNWDLTSFVDTVKTCFNTEIYKRVSHKAKLEKVGSVLFNSSLHSNIKIFYTFKSSVNNKKLEFIKAKYRDFYIISLPDKFIFNALIGIKHHFRTTDKINVVTNLRKAGQALISLLYEKGENLDTLIVPDTKKSVTDEAIYSVASNGTKSYNKEKCSYNKRGVKIANLSIELLCKASEFFPIRLVFTTKVLKRDLPFKPEFLKTMQELAETTRYYSLLKMYKTKRDGNISFKYLHLINNTELNELYNTYFNSRTYNSIPITNDFGDLFLEEYEKVHGVIDIYDNQTLKNYKIFEDLVYCLKIDYTNDSCIDALKLFAHRNKLTLKPIFYRQDIIDLHRQFLKECSNLSYHIKQKVRVWSNLVNEFEDLSNENVQFLTETYSKVRGLLNTFNVNLNKVVLPDEVISEEEEQKAIPF